MAGILLEQAPQDWQILQQKEGYADILLSGRVVDPPSADGSERVLARVVEEATGALVVPPVICPLQGDRFSLCIPGVPAGGLYRIETCLRFREIAERRGDRRHHIGVGDVFLIAGQSNAVGVGKDTVSDPPEPGIHQFRLCGRWDMASHPLHDSTATLFPAAQEQCQTGHSPWISFARTLRRQLGYPIGLIPAAKGGVPLSTWDRTADGYLFDTMLEIVQSAGSGLKGVLWYHGCNDANPQDSPTYLSRFQRVVEDFRQCLGGELPFLTVQLNKTTCTKNSTGAARETMLTAWATIREAQRQAAFQIPEVTMIPSIDMKVCDGVHNAAISNMALGERLARVALGHLYGMPVCCDAPQIAWAKQTGEQEITAEFGHVVDHLNTDIIRTEHLMFTARDARGILEPVDYNREGRRIILRFGRTPEGETFLDCRRMNEQCLMPYDPDTYLPVVPFYGFPVELTTVKGE